MLCCITYVLVVLTTLLQERRLIFKYEFARLRGQPWEVRKQARDATRYYSVSLCPFVSLSLCPSVPLFLRSIKLKTQFCSGGLLLCSLTCDFYCGRLDFATCFSG